MRLDDIYKKIQQLDEALNEAASASINMSGDNAEDVIKLMNALKGTTGASAGEEIPTAIKPPMPPMMGPMEPADDMAKLRDIVTGPDMDDMDNMDMDDLKPGKQEPCKICGKAHLGNSGCGESVEDEGYENEPDETYQDQHYMTKDLSGGSEQGQKKSYPKAAGGDNPMALEAQIAKDLAAQLKTFMSEGKGCECNDGGSCDCNDSCEDCSCK
jgi:hypothetical protein